LIFFLPHHPGNEKAVGAIINGLITQGLEVIPTAPTWSMFPAIPRRDELRDIISWCVPQLLIPVHGEALHLSEHASLRGPRACRKVLVCRNGDLVKLGRATPNHRRTAVGTALQGRLNSRDSKSRAVVERRRMGFAAARSCHRHDRNGELADDPR